MRIAATRPHEVWRRPALRPKQRSTADFRKVANPMRLSQDKARQLSSLVWRERIRRWLPPILAIVAVFGLATYMLARQLDHADRTLETHMLSGVVTHITRAGARSAIAHVHLTDGRDVDATSVMTIIPPVGTHVVVNESLHKSGRQTFDVKGLANE